MKSNFGKVTVLLALLVLLGRVSFDLHFGTDIPISGQSLAVLLIGYYLSYSQIIVLFLIYFGAGCLHIPVFADGSSGFEHFTGNSGGYLYAFPLAAILIRKLTSMRTASSTSVNLSWLLLIFLVGTALILLVGMLHLSQNIGIAKAWKYGVLPYIPGGIIKAIVAVFVVYFLDYVRHNKLATVLGLD